MQGDIKHRRRPAVAGAFYPADAAVLRRDITAYLREADGVGPYPKALIVPHAGYPYSGPVADINNTVPLRRHGEKSNRAKEFHHAAGGDHRRPDPMARQQTQNGAENP